MIPNTKLICFFVMDCLREARACDLNELATCLLFYAICREGEAVHSMEIASSMLVSPEQIINTLPVLKVKGFVEIVSIDDFLFRLQPTLAGKQLVSQLLGLE